MIEAVLFDGDGCAYDTMDHATNATLRAARKLNETTATSSGIKAAFSSGLSLSEVFSIAAPNTDPAAMNEAFYAEGETQGYDTIQCFPRVYDILDRIIMEGRTTALITNRNRRSTMQIVTALGLEEVVMDIVTSDDVTEHKPSPEGIYKILQWREVLPSNAIYIGDTSGDMITAHNAGLLACVGFTQGFGSPQQLLEAGATVLMESWDQLPEIVRSFE